MSSTPVDEAVIRRLYDGVWNDTDPAVADELVAPDYHIHDRDIADELSGPDLYRALADRTRVTFPDATFTVDDTVVGDGRVAVRWTMTGTHEGDELGVGPTGKRVTLAGIEINRFEDGLLAETWTQTDTLGLLQSVGAIPADET